jgi:dTDP-4-dehydrorhamnose reductase
MEYYRKMKNKILIIGGTGKLGKTFKKNKFFKNSFYPSKKTLDIRSKTKIKKFLKTRKIEIIINCAAIARMSKCEENKPLAFETNVNGTMNLVLEILKKKNLKLIHISSDAVYKSIKGNYREDDKLDFYNFYGLTKILSDYIVRYLKDYLIIRTRFYDKKEIKFKKYASDSFSSAIEVNELVRIIEKLVKKNVNGVINIGSKRRSDFQIYKKLRKNILSKNLKYIKKNLNFNISKDSSLNLNKQKKILK